MATKSFLKDVTISIDKLPSWFIEGLDSKHVPVSEPSRPVRELEAEEIKDFFGVG